MDRNLPATRPDSPPGVVEQRPELARRQPLSVAYLPLALVTFIILALAIATWTFLAAAG